VMLWSSEGVNRRSEAVPAETEPLCTSAASKDPENTEARLRELGRGGLKLATSGVALLLGSLIDVPRDAAGGSLEAAQRRPALKDVEGRQLASWDPPPSTAAPSSSCPQSRQTSE